MILNLLKTWEDACQITTQSKDSGKDGIVVITDGL
jgi:hypothetical protein